MEFQKDNQKDNNSTSHYNNSGVAASSSLLNVDNYLSFLFKKTEKLVTVFYMITNFFSSEEPLKWNIRKIGLALLSKNLSLMRGAMVDKHSVLRQIMSLMIEVGAMLEIAYRSGYISEMNFTILKKEVDLFVENLNTTNLHKAENIYPLDKSFFEVGNASVFQNLTKETLSQISKSVNDNKNTLISHNITKPIEQAITNPIAKKHLVIKEKENKIILETKLQTFTKKNVDKNSRQDLILSIFRKYKGQEFSIKDITNFVKDCGEKTIQRVLSTLVEKNMLRKEGERRWSKYSLI